MKYQTYIAHRPAPLDRTERVLLRLCWLVARVRGKVSA